MLLLPFQIFLPQSVDTINHDLDQLDLRVSKTVLVRDVISASSLATRFSTGSTRLDTEFFTASLELVNRFLGPAREVNIDRVSNSLDSTSKTLKYTLDITSLLHGDNSCLIFLINPEKEGFSSIVEDSTALRPVTLHTSNSKVTVSTDKEEVIINKLLADLLIHAGQRIVTTSKIS